MGHHHDRRRELGAWYTPPRLVAHVVASTLPATLSGRVHVVDPACGDGRFLVEAAHQIRARGGEPVLTGIDVDPDAIDSARSHPDLADAHLVRADALAADTSWGHDPIDVVLGNPPFLSPLSARVLADGRRRNSPSAGGVYADVAVQFLARAVGEVRDDTGRVGLVLPLSVLASRDARTVRHLISTTCRLDWFWWSSTPVFDAAVTTCAIGVRRAPSSSPRPQVRRSVDIDITPADPVAQPSPADDTWGELVAGDLGIPTVTDLETDGCFGDRARVVADFRDQYYGIVDALVDLDPSSDPPFGVAPLATSTHIDPGRCAWGCRPARYAKSRWTAPGVDVSHLDERMRDWVASRLVPKVMVATQTRVVEAVADRTGRWLPAVPIVSVIPVSTGAVDGAASVEEIAAVLTSPVPSALIARRAAGTGMSPRVVRVTARQIADLPWPRGALQGAVDALRSGRLRECAEQVTIAYGLPEPERTRLLDWWEDRLPR